MQQGALSCDLCPIYVCDKKILSGTSRKTENYAMLYNVGQE